MEKAEGLVKEEVGSVKPPQRLSHIGNAVELTFPGNDSSCKVDELLKAVEVPGGAGTVHAQAVADVRDH